MTATAKTEGLLRMAALAEQSGVSAATIKHYLREGLLPPPVKTSRNMAWYSPQYVDRIKLIKRLQEERYLPLDVIRRILENEPDQVEARLELGDALLQRSEAAMAIGKGITRKQAVSKLDLPEDVLDGFERIGAIEPHTTKSGVRYSQPDAEFLTAIAEFRKSGYGEALGFTVYDALIYMRHLEALARDEVDVISEKLPGKLSADDAADLIERGHGPMRDLLSAMHVKLLVAELRRRQDG
ncbi:MAG: MerR family transcriptional regulator [Thermoleophilaceae bacterium]|nr:MerR family transcriptional regulator [Thermoleophilaceae bacterium]